ncbi:hypothetical protein TWF694_011068 [Orbilia ellipsospora]|uniref:DM2 domain-containing protein n=1 Tax=Orbilia ellipsospora TaxID=2528407 RepID=A0AAV9X887_9PEZI
MEFDPVLYTPIVDRILRSSDLASITSKGVRKSLQTELGYDISDHKTQVTDLIKERFDLILEETGPDNVQPVKKESNGYEGEDGYVKKEESGTSPSKKRKSVASSLSVDDDARLAAKLQAEWNSQDRPSRSTTVKRKVVAPRKKKKSRATVSDDSDVEEGEKKKRKINVNNPFHKPLILSPQLSTLLGETQLSRPETVKRIWAYIRENGLQDQSDKRYIICDENLRTVFPTAKVHMFTMNKILSGHLYPINGSSDPANVKIEDIKNEDVASSPVSADFSHQGSPSSVASEAS